MKTPDLAPEEMQLDIEYVNRILGIDFSSKDVKELLERMRYGVNLKANKIHVLIPAYRADILHPIDLVEDIAIAYGYDKFKPELPKLYTPGSKEEIEKFSSSTRELMIGSGFQEIMSMILTNKESLFEKMNLSEEDAVETKHPVSLEHSVARTWLLPALMSILQRNKNREYPQKLFEIGLCMDSKGRDNRKLAGVIAHSTTNFSETKATLTGIMESIGLEYKIKKSKHDSFIVGRVASLDFGFFGEIHPQVLDNFGLEVPVTAFELNLDEIFAKLK
ncbi:MAG: hypothetical protein L6243_07025 [Candidatus Altiarchaeales archaeon]|nr:hypothetical protein [Candidatus Altiarchaeota archaeon]MBU4265943.1 hypothetical protein [Candidatus Altiarchaeota archaeon]MBU4341500.1 hypothetical protein [Candidatus Altiarchaeota archaeon]MBU4437254.1 hypothetical protein [Candidatus Altiarchaeota archaeon]MCG2783323.1 hypothetical protein [Candidatus Altiarchaeales archaeon]